MTTTPLNVDLLEEDDDEEKNIGAETNAVQPQVIEKKDDEQTRVDEISNKYDKARKDLTGAGLHPETSVDLTQPWNEEEDTFAEGKWGKRPWYDQLAWWILAPDFDQRQTAHLLDNFEKVEKEKLNVVEGLTNYYTEGITRGFKHELTRIDSPGKFAARVPYAALRTIGIPKAQANLGYLGTGDAVLGAILNVADWDWGELAKVPGFDALALLPEKYRKGSYIDKGFGWTDTAQRAMYTAHGFKDPAEWTQEEINGMEARSSLMLNVGLGLLTLGSGNLIAGSSNIATKAPYLAKATRWLNPSNAKNMLDAFARLSVINVLDEFPSTWLDRNEGGSAASFLSFAGIDWDPATTPGLTKWESAEKAFGPNLAASLLFTTALNYLPLKQGIKDAKTGFEKWEPDIEGPLAAGKNIYERADIITNKAYDWIEGNFQNTYRAIRSKDIFNRRTEIRNNQVKSGLIEETTDGGYKQGTLAFEETKPTAEEAAQALKDKYIKPENAVESDALEEALDTGSTAELIEIETRVEAGEPVVTVTDEVLSRPVAEKEFPSTEKFNLVEESEEGLEFELEMVDDLDKEQLGKLLEDRKILARIKKLTGKDKGDPWVTIDRIDIAKALKDLQANDGLVIQRTPDVYEEAMENVRRINENLKAEKVEGEAPIERVDTRGFEKEDMLAYQRLVNSIDKAIGSEWKGGLDSAGDVLNVLNVARVTLEEGVQRALRDFARVTTSLSGRRLNVDEQLPGAKFVLNQARRDRRELLNGITKRALERGEARPPSTTLPKTPEPGNFNSEKVVDDLLNGRVTDDVIEALDNEVRLIEENGKLDAAREADQKIAERRVSDYESKTYEQKKAEGLLDNLKQRKEGFLPFAARKFSDVNEETIPKMPDRDLLVEIASRKKKKLTARQIANRQKVLKKFQALNDEQAAITQKFSDASLEELGDDTKYSDSLLDKRDEIYEKLKKAGVFKKEKELAENDLLNQLLAEKARREAEGISIPISPATQNMENLMRKGQEIKYPDSKAFDVKQSSFGPDTDFTGGEYNERLVRQQLMEIQAGEKITKNQHLMNYGAEIENSLIGRIQQSKVLADEAKEALKDAYKISGLLPEQLGYLNEIESIKLFGLDATIGSVAEWRPHHATFMARNPDDPLTKTAAGQTSGLFYGDKTGNVHKSMILLALHPNLGHRLGGLSALDGVSPRWLGIDAAHESFHSVQEWLDFLGATKYQEALLSEKGLADMVEIIKKGGGNYKEGMSPFEIQAEAFGVWFANRKIKLKAGPIKSSFERIKMFLSALRRKINFIRKKDPSFVDVFELAANGTIARRGLIKKLTPEQLQGLVPRIDAAINAEMPELTMQVFKFLEAKKLAYDDLLGSNNSKFYKGGCT